MQLQRLLCGFLTTAALHAAPAALVVEGDFANWPEGKPAGWAPRSPAAT